MECSFEGCARRTVAKGLCQPHWQQQWRGVALAPIRKQLRGKVDDRFWGYVVKGNESDCWPWRGAADKDGYGLFSIRASLQKKAHRMAWELTHGPIPSGLFACHRCDNPPCVNPGHLFLGTAADNNRDRDAKGRSRHVSLRGEEARCSKLRNADVLDIRRRASLGETNSKIAALHGIDKSHVSVIVRRLQWTHI